LHHLFSLTVGFDVVRLICCHTGRICFVMAMTDPR
jgi:hypothetical protein